MPTCKCGISARKIARDFDGLIFSLGAGGGACFGGALAEIFAVMCHIFYV